MERGHLFPDTHNRKYVLIALETNLVNYFVIQVEKTAAAPCGEEII